MKNTISAFCSFSIFFNFLQAAFMEDWKKAEMIQDLAVIKHHFEVGYAPTEWKKEYADWDLNKAFEKSKNQILDTPSITTKQFQQIVRDFVKTMKDYHVGVLFYSTERASLPFSVKGIEGRYFIDWIDPIRLAYSSMRVGDELLEFDGRPITDVIADLAQQSGKSSNLQTDQAFAEMKLTIRAGFVGDDVPKNGTVLVTTKSMQTGKMMTNQLRWLYMPEQVTNSLDFRDFLNCISFLLPNAKKEQAKFEFPKIEMMNPVHQSYVEKYADRKGGLGSRKSFLPPLGDILWSGDDVKEKNEGSTKEQENTIPFWHAYIYQHPEGYHIGYIRIPHYLVSFEEMKKFGEIVSFMEEATDALVIDQLHNLGGFVHVVYGLASMLTQQPLQTPYHRVKISQREAMIAYQTLEFIKLLEWKMEMDENSQDSSNSKKDQGQDKKDSSNPDESEEDEDKFDYQQILFLKDYYNLILEDWNKGHTLTRPTPIDGVDKINPHPKYHYTKPILMLVNEMDFSGGDFMPAILQDNKRVVLFGNRTAGAGGFVQSFHFPNTHGIAFCSYTASIAERSNLQKIENLGVTPDIEYQLTLDDMLNNYQGYIEAVNQSIETLVGDLQLLDESSEVEDVSNVENSLEMETVPKDDTPMENARSTSERENINNP